jgi:hypothetical protein
LPAFGNMSTGHRKSLCQRQLCADWQGTRKKTPKTGGGGQLLIFSENRGGPVAFFWGYCFPVGILCIYRGIAGGINESLCHLPPNRACSF